MDVVYSPDIDSNFYGIDWYFEFNLYRHCLMWKSTGNAIIMVTKKTKPSKEIITGSVSLQAPGVLYHCVICKVFKIPKGSIYGMGAPNFVVQTDV